MLMTATTEQRLTFVSRILDFTDRTVQYRERYAGHPATQARLKATLPAIYTAYRLQDREDAQDPQP